MFFFLNGAPRLSKFKVPQKLNLTVLEKVLVQLIGILSQHELFPEV